MSDHTPRRVLIVLKTNEGGTWILPQVRELRARGHEVAIAIPPGEGRLTTKLADEGFALLQHDFDFDLRPRAALGREFLKFVKAVHRFRPDVIGTHLYASALVARSLGVLLRVPVVHMVAGPLYLESDTIRRIERYAMRLDDTVIAGSDFTFDAYAQLRGARSRPRLCTNTYGIDLEQFGEVTPAERDSARQSLGISDDTFVAIIVAYFYAPKSMVFKGVGIKGHETLLEAWETVRKEASGPAELLVVGSGFDAAAEEYRQRVIRTTDDPTIRFVDTTQDVRSYYAAADLSVSPSLSENHGAAVEAGALGTPSVVSDAGGLPETVSDGVGWTVPAGDAAALATAVSAAESEFRTGALVARRALARQLVSARWDQEATAAAFADEIERAATSDEVLVLTEAHFAESAAAVGALDGVNGDRQWSRYVGLHGRIKVAGRSRTVEELPDKADRLTTGWLVPVPEYGGLAGTVTSGPRTWRTISREARDSAGVLVRAPGAFATLGTFAALRHRKPLFVDLVGDAREVVDALVPGVIGRVIGMAAGAATRFTVRSARGVRYVSQETLQNRYPARKGAQTFGFSNVDLDPTTFYPPSDLSVRGELKLIAVGTHANAYKGHDLAIRAVADLARQGKDLHLTLVGEGELQPQLRQLVDDLGVKDLVTFTGALRSKALGEAMRAHHVLVQPSRTEGIPRVVIEAQACGLATVGSRAGGIPELVPETCLFDIDDLHGLTRLLSGFVESPDVVASMRKKNVESARVFSRATITARFLEWSELIADRSKTQK